MSAPRYFIRALIGDPMPVCVETISAEPLYALQQARQLAPYALHGRVDLYEDIPRRGDALALVSIVAVRRDNHGSPWTFRIMAIGPRPADLYAAMQTDAARYAQFEREMVACSVHP